MSEVPKHPSPPAEIAATTAALLALGDKIERISLLLSAVALLALVTTLLAIAPRLCLFLALAAGLGEHFFALRTAFDYRIFTTWAQRWQTPSADQAADMAAFDASLATLGLGTVNTAPPRSLAERLAGARRLLRCQGLCWLLQLYAWLSAALIVALEN